jgi:hypothetical protein
MKKYSGFRRIHTYLITAEKPVVQSHCFKYMGIQNPLSSLNAMYEEIELTNKFNELVEEFINTRSRKTAVQTLDKLVDLCKHRTILNIDLKSLGQLFKTYADEIS